MQASKSLPESEKRLPESENCSRKPETIQEYAALCVGQMRCRAMRPAVEKELRAHMEDQEEAYLADGKAPEEAERLAVAQMGDPVEAGLGLDRVHRPRMDWKAIGLICALALAGVAIQFIWAGQSGNLLTAQRFAVCTGIGIALMIAVCFADYTVIGKYPKLSWCVATVLSAAVYLATEQVNGASRAGYMVMLIVPCFAGLVWFYRPQKWVGIAKASGWLLLSWTLLLACGGLQDGLMTKIWLCGCIAVLAFAVGKGWYGIPKGRAVLILLIPAVMMCFYIGKIFFTGAAYQTARIKALFGLLLGKEVSGDGNYVWQAVREELGHLRLTGAAAVKATGEVLPGNESYALLWISENYGIIAAVAILAVLAALTGFLVCRMCREKNRLGALAGVGCIYVLAVSAAVHGLVNFGVLMPMDCALPFLSMKGRQCIVLYALMGVLLSVYRGSYIRPEPLGACAAASGEKRMKLL